MEEQVEQRDVGKVNKKRNYGYVEWKENGCLKTSAEIKNREPSLQDIHVHV